jgi:hypothetical protein
MECVKFRTVGFPQYGFKLRHHTVRSGTFRRIAPRLRLIPDIPADRSAFAPAFETRVRLPGSPPLCADLWRCSSHLSPEVLAPEGFCCPFLPRLATSSASLETSASFPRWAGYSDSLWHARILLPGLHTFGLSLLSSPGLPPAASAGSLVCAPPFFCTSTGQRGEGRNPWHLRCSRQSASRGDPMSTARSFALATALLVARLLG